ncbi:MAG: hypothetical protein K0R71_1681 [Bacillales bacterium]|jgi:hypothetical protein|nr:hypothetical protein [Bacillales bacterium]
MITVRVDELLKRAQELTKDGYEFVEVMIIEEEYDDETLPSSLHFSAFDGFGGGVDYEAIDEIKISATYKFEEGNKEDEEYEGLEQ